MISRAKKKISLVLVAILTLATVWLVFYSHAGQNSHHNTSITYSTPEFGTGNLQSPIDIHSYEVQEGHHTITLEYRSSAKHITNTGHTIQLDVDPGSVIHFDGHDYALRQFHFHTPSEHHIDGMTFPLEMHLVHTLVNKDSECDQFLVVGILFKEGPDSPFLSSFLLDVPENPGGHIDDFLTQIDLAGFIPNEELEHCYHYEGSLTTPPYSETVHWVVLKTIKTASPVQIRKINEIEGDNARHIQQAEMRVVESN